MIAYHRAAIGFAACILIVHHAAAQTAGFSVTDASPAGALGDPGNSTTSGTFSSSFTAKSLSWSGTLTSSPDPFFFEEDVYASIQGPNGIGYSGPIAGEQGIVLGSTPFSGWSSGFTPADVDGAFSFEAYTPNTLPDSTDWSIASGDFDFNASLFPGAVSIGAGSTETANITEGEILWYSINHAGGALEFSTAGSSIFELDGAIQTDDTLIALFDSTGELVDFNDDAAGDPTSLLSFADLAGGEYRLAVTGSTLGTRVGDRFIATSHDGAGSINLAVAVPAPSAVLPLAFGITLASRRRRLYATPHASAS